MATMAPALTETATEGHGFQLSSSSLPSSSIEPDTFMDEEDTPTEQKLNGECDTQSVWSQLAHPFAAHGLGSDATDLKHVPYGPVIVHSSIPNNTTLLTSANSLLDILSLKCNLKSKNKLFSKNSVILAKKELPCDRTKQTSASNASKMYVPEAELRSNKNGMKDLSSQKNSSLKCLGVLTAACEMKLACSSVSVSLNTPGSITSNQKAELKSIKADKTWDTVPAEDAIQIRNLLRSARQSAQQRKPEKLSNFTSTRETEMDTQLLECLGRQQELAKKASQLRKRLQLIQAKHVEHHVQCKIQELIESQHQRQTEISKIASSKTESAIFAGVKHGDSVQSGFVPNPINSELYEYMCFSKALLSRIEENVDSDATVSSTDEDSDSEEVSLKRNMPFKYRSEWRWTIDRAAIASRWTWLQAQISELEYRIRQINEIYRHIRAVKEIVILDDSQHSKDVLKKPMQLTEAATLLAATEDNKAPAEIKDSTLECNLEMSPSSPSLLLRNIDKQSAQLTESVNSLIPPLNLSPASSPVSCKACRHLDGITCSSGCEESKKKQLVKATQRTLSMDDTSARTRPLRMQHKHRLFSCVYDVSRQVQQATTVQCKCCWPVSCEMCGPDKTTDALDSRTMTLEEQVAVLDPCFHPILSLHCDIPLSVHVQGLLHNEDWNKQPFPSILNALKASLSNSTLCKSHTCEDALDLVRCNMNKDLYAKALGQHWNQSSSVPKLQTPAEASRKPLKELRKRRHSNEKTTVLNKRHCAPLNSSEFPSGSLVKTAQPPVPIQHTPCSSPADVWALRSTPPQRPLAQAKDIPLRQRQQSEYCYDIDNIVIPMSLVATSKIEKLQYKEIVTPSWRIVAIKPLKERHIQGKMLEDLSDEAFALRHKKHERREQARWFLWEQSRCHRRSNRLSSFSKNNDEHLNPHLPASPDNESQLNYSSSVCCVSEMVQSEETQDLLLEGVTNAKVVLPWNCRTFPLSDEEVKCLTHPEVVVFDKSGFRPLTRSYLALSGNSPAAPNQSPPCTGTSERVPFTGQIIAEETECKLPLRGQNSVKK
ncbi:KAT8 regulatory NSL complex subunit 1-like protein isoform X2 [Carcharodon carcharias]|uniref:KAT8 regulatory NSL complex subunit 1-like protein isoform X2 n=1 Tax=Carcharodon carcharias TaxID=13397 RepID=UPI001B7E1201|nr:KAT8 regulatory NSL complex subunit 1-like protein isoform X2 [Carcharodon carcharias]